ncbi:restriction endonuclease subunit S [Labrenzia sp. PO1]|uniref:restriction endonuclease subunit S n=1 Tax=Labrenzia sp. PO1 TaxID=2720390 RepID=UPI001447396C|nr:restriction endonuclease subunit S [Labrenzia sp. PO1]NKI59621.1 restriction endonuclease subunit S [Labrenzia sp. PO1]
MPKTIVSDLVEPIIDKQVADQARPEAYIGLEHIPERAIRIERAGNTEAIRGMCVRFSKGDILFGKLRPNLRKSVLAPVDGLGSTEIVVLRPKPGVDPSFAGHVLRSEAVFFEAERMTEGTRMPRTSWKTLSEIEVFAPSDESAQKLIADVLNAIDDAILETDAVIEKLNAVGKGIAADLFYLGLDSNGELRQPDALTQTALGALPLDWTVDRLDTIFGVFGGKRLPLGHTYAMEETGFRYLRVTDFFGEASRPHELPSLKARTFKALQRYEITDGALAVSIAGSIGRFYPFNNDTDLRVILTENAARLEPKKSINPDFYARFLNSLPVQKQVELEIGTGGGVPKLALHRIQALKVVDVPRDEQDEISRRLSALELEIQAYREERAKLSSLREGLRDDLLTGRKPVVAIREAAE